MALFFFLSCLILYALRGPGRGNHHLECNTIHRTPNLTRRRTMEMTRDFWIWVVHRRLESNAAVCAALCKLTGMIMTSVRLFSRSVRFSTSSATDTSLPSLTCMFQFNSPTCLSNFLFPPIHLEFSTYCRQSLSFLWECHQPLSPAPPVRSLSGLLINATELQLYHAGTLGRENLYLLGKELNNGMCMRFRRVRKSNIH